MPTESEDELQASAVKYLRRHSMHHDEWKFTRLGQLHPELEEAIGLAPGERVIVSSLVSIDSWYSFTTRRLVAKLGGDVQSIDVLDAEDESFGNFKGYRPGYGPGSQVTEIGTIKSRSTGERIQIEFETLYASMAPIYACKFFMRRTRRLQAEQINAHDSRADA